MKCDAFPKENARTFPKKTRYYFFLSTGSLLYALYFKYNIAVSFFFINILFLQTDACSVIESSSGFSHLFKPQTILLQNMKRNLLQNNMSLLKR